MTITRFISCRLNHLSLWGNPMNCQGFKGIEDWNVSQTNWKRFAYWSITLDMVSCLDGMVQARSPHIHVLAVWEGRQEMQKSPRVHIVVIIHMAKPSSNKTNQEVIGTKKWVISLQLSQSFRLGAESTSYCPKLQNREDESTPRC